MSAATATRAPGGTRAARRFGYLVAIACNAVGLWIAYHLLDWGWPRFLTDSFEELLPIITLSLVAGMVVNALFIVADPAWFKSLCNMITAGIALVVSVRTLQVFPFDFSSYAHNWSWALRALFIVAAIGSAIAMVVDLIAMLRELPRRHAPDRAAPSPSVSLPRDTEGGTDRGGRAVVVYESMFGATHLVADRIAEGLGDAYEVTTVSVHDATPEVLSGAALVVVGGPTHIHGMSSHHSRESAVEIAAKSDNDLHLDPDAEGDGLREWFDRLPAMAGVPAAAFDTRTGAVSALMSGQTSKGIIRRLRRHDFDVVAGPQSFLVGADGELEPGEADRATEWARSLAGTTVVTT